MAVLCKDVVDNVGDYIDRALDRETTSLLERHLTDCAQCRVFLETYKKLLDLAGRLKGKSFVDPEMRDRLKAFLVSKIAECE